MSDASRMSSARRLFIEDLMYSNPTLTFEEAADYAARIAQAEGREDYTEFHRLLMEAVYGSRSAA